MNVPPFFVLSADAFKKFIQQNKLESEFHQRLAKKDFDGIRKLIMRGKFSPDIEKEIITAATKLKAKKIAVRSSAMLEDGSEKSFAGQFSSFLNVDKKDIPQAIKKVWASLFNQNAIAYQSKNFDIFGMAVIVQKMINPAAAGVAFSIDPTGSDKNYYMLIESCRGTGDKLVSGKITPTKYFARRQTKKIDMIIGRPHIDDAVRIKLVASVLEIEKEFGLPVDVEWCRDKNNKLYILQARPITSLSPAPTEYGKVLSRPHSIMRLQIYRHVEVEGIKDLTGGLCCYRPLFVYDARRDTVDVYYDMVSIEQIPKTFYKVMDDNFARTRRRARAAEKSVKPLLEYIGGKRKFDYEKFIKEFTSVCSLQGLGSTASRTKPVPKRVLKILTDLRKRYDWVCYKAEEFLIDKAAELVAPEFKSDLRFLKMEEVFGSIRPDKKEIAERKKGFVYFDNMFTYTANPKNILSENNLFIPDDVSHSGALKGTVAYKGSVTGIVKIINSPKDFPKFNKGDIIVSSMTLPSFTAVMKIAGGIVTNEGGTACHAAIVARELKVPCIIGTGYATTMLKDGDMIEVDANSGCINIVKGKAQA